MYDELRNFGIGVTTYKSKYCNDDDLEKQLAIKSDDQIFSLFEDIDKHSKFSKLFCWQKTFINFSNVECYNIDHMFKFYNYGVAIKEKQKMRMYNGVKCYTFNFDDGNDLYLHKKISYYSETKLYMLKLQNGYLMTYISYTEDYRHDICDMLSFMYDDITMLVEKNEGKFKYR